MFANHTAGELFELRGGIPGNSITQLIPALVGFIPCDESETAGMVTVNGIDCRVAAQTQ